MKIKHRLTLLFSVITTTILFLFAFVIYYSAKKDREQEFYLLLRKEAITKANLFLNARVDSKTLQDIYLNNRKILNEVEVAIYDTSFKLLYHDAVEIDFVKETKEMIDEIHQKEEIHFYQDNWQVVGLRYDFQDNTYITTATAIDQYGYNKLDSLFKTMAIVLVISLLVIYIAGRYFSKKAFDPVKEMTQKAAAISASNLDLRLPTQGKKDELSLLAHTFNQMLSRLESSFEAQKHFVSNISHELRTPLAAIIAETELSVDKDRTVEEYKTALQHTLIDAKKLVKLSNNLLDLAKASYDPSEISFRSVRIDEVLLDARQQVRQASPDYKIDLHFDTEFLQNQNDQQISVNGNEYLLKVAFANLFENGCKFSADQQCMVYIAIDRGQIRLRFVDQGVGIPEEDLHNIFIPFFRGANRTFSDGNGIGLSLTQKIIALHRGRIHLTSQEGIGTSVTVLLPHSSVF